VLRATTSGGPYTVVANNLPQTTTQYTVTGQTNGTPVYFTVEAVNSIGAIRSLEAAPTPTTRISSSSVRPSPAAT
jgi:hypothetical protein